MRANLEGQINEGRFPAVFYSTPPSWGRQAGAGPGGEVGGQGISGRAPQGLHRSASIHPLGPSL